MQKYSKGHLFLGFRQVGVGPRKTPNELWKYVNISLKLTNPRKMNDRTSDTENMDMDAKIKTKIYQACMKQHHEKWHRNATPKGISPQGLGDWRTGKS